MFAALFTIFVLPPLVAEKPAVKAYTLRVDLIVINRHRQVREWEEMDHRYHVVRRREYTETWWVSFWDLTAVSIPGLGPVYIDFVDRGWWSIGNLENVTRCSEGFCVTKKTAAGQPAGFVIGTKLWIVDSPYDWEVRNRRIYRPLAMPR